MSATSQTIAHRFAADKTGSVAMMFGLSALVLMMFSGAAIDFARLAHAKSRLAAAVDAAALAGGQALIDGRSSNRDVTEIVERVFTANLYDGGGSVDETIATPRVKINKNTGLITVDATAEVPMTIMKIAGFNSFDVPVTAATKFDQRDIELAMALDVTGSMGGRKIRDLKQATKDLVDILLPDGGTPNKVRIAFAPYSNGVNAGSYAFAATGQSRLSCAYERDGRDALTDAAPRPGSYLKVAYDPGVFVDPRDRNADCPMSSPVVALSDDKDMLKRTVDGYRTGGSTAGHLGAQWAWYLVSPKWSRVFGTDTANYNDGQTIKAVVLMTDGLFNTIGGRNFGDSSSEGRTSRDMTKSLCDAMRGNSIRVFTVGFALRDIGNNSFRDEVTETLQDCAGQKDRFFNAEDGEQLRTAFSNIARQLNNLRLIN